MRNNNLEIRIVGSSCRTQKYLSLMKRFRITFTANGDVDLYHLTKFSLYLSLTVHYNYTDIISFMPVLSIIIVCSPFYRLNFFF